MITIKPTTESGLQHSIYSLDLLGDLQFVRERAKKITQTIDGGVAVTLFAKVREGAELTKDFTLNPEQFKVLSKIIYHRTCFEWLVLTGEDRFVCSLDLLQADKTTFQGQPDWQKVRINFLVTQDLTGTEDIE